MTSRNEVVVIETPVTDFIYDEEKANKRLRADFLRHYVRPENPPRVGENFLISAEEWCKKLLAFGDANHLLSDQGTDDEKAAKIKDIIFGPPRSIVAGGALANSFDTLIKARINDKPLTDGVFVTAIGEGIAGKVFAEAFEGYLIAPQPKGHQLEAHVFQIGDDRIMASIPSFSNPPSQYMSPQQLDQIIIDQNTKMVMLGGYMQYTGKYNDFLDAILNKVANVSPNLQRRPTIVLTAAAQEIAASRNVQQALARASLVAPVIVSANTGEFRRLMGMDTEWRKPHEAKWWFDSKGERLADFDNCASRLDFYDSRVQDNLRKFGWVKLEGEELERVKQSDPAYMDDKLKADEAAFQAAYELYCENTTLPVTFVITNGKKGVHVIDGSGISKNYTVPKPPHGVKNTVGGGDGFAGGYLLGHLLGWLPQDCVALGFICAGEIIGQDEARLVPIEVVVNVDDSEITLKGLPAYLDSRNPVHNALLIKLYDSLSDNMDSPNPDRLQSRLGALNRSATPPHTTPA